MGPCSFFAAGDMEHMFSNQASIKAQCICTLPNSGQWKQTFHLTTVNTRLNSALHIEV